VLDGRSREDAAAQWAADAAFTGACRVDELAAVKVADAAIRVVDADVDPPPLVRDPGGAGNQRDREEAIGAVTVVVANRDRAIGVQDVDRREQTLDRLIVPPPV